MCGRYTVRDTQAVQREYGAVVKPSYNVAPSQDVVVVTDKLKP